MRKKNHDNIKLESVNNRDNKEDERASVDLEGEDFYISTPIVSNYYFQYKDHK